MPGSGRRRRQRLAPRPQQASEDHARSCERTIICVAGSLGDVDYSFADGPVVSPVLTRGRSKVVQSESPRRVSKDASIHPEGGVSSGTGGRAFRSPSRADLSLERPARTDALARPLGAG
jgi:hypothetical protein